MNGYMGHLRNNVIRINRDIEHLRNDIGTTICNSYITGPSFVADLLHGKSARAIARGLLRAINRLQNEGT